MENQSHSSSQNDCYSTNEEYFLDICRFGEFQEIKEFLSSLNSESKFDWEWASNSGDNFVHMLSGNNFPDIFVFLIDELKQRGHGQKIFALINKPNSSGNTPLHYTVITESKQMLLKLLEYGCDTSILNEFGRTALDEAELIQKFQIAEILAPVTKPDMQKLRKQFGALDVCNQDDSSQQEEDQTLQKKQKIEEQQQ